MAKKKKRSIRTNHNPRMNKKGIDRQSLVILSALGLFVIALIVYQVYYNVSPATWVSADEQLPNNKVCMVNDAYLGVAQIEVPVNGKIYYGCCEMCVTKLNNDRSVRYGIDPLTGLEVDKSDAFIVLKSKTTGEVMYFETKENFTKFKELNGNLP